MLLQRIYITRYGTSNSQRERTTTLWSQLSITNKWMFAVNHTLTIHIICEGQSYAQQLEGSGFIKFNAKCLIEHDSMIIESFETITTHLNASFTPAFNLTDISQTTTGQLQLE